jgi:two-component system, NarL family, sensor kinase
MLRRLPFESAGPVLVFAATRVVATALAILGIVAFGLPDDTTAALLVGAVALPWTLFVLFVTRREPAFAINPIVPIVDFSLLVLLEVVAPDTVGAVRVAALFLVASHAHFQGERRGMAVAALGSASLVVATAIRGEHPVENDVFAFYEVVFMLSALATGVVVGTLRTAESASRLRARGLSRRTIQAENQVRRRVAEAIHDGPVQELIGLDMILSAAGQAADGGRREETVALIEEARELTTRNIRALRDEIVDLGPHAFQELSFDQAVENCIPVWRRRYGFEVLATIQRMELPSEMAGDLFRIVQEAVVNAGRHAHADAVSINLRSNAALVELRVTDNGRGFGSSGPLADSEPGHLGLASIRERAELLDGTLDIESSELGTRVLVKVPGPRQTAGAG